MIQVTISKGLMNNPTSIKVSGHAGYAEHGKDIVCASVSMLLQSVGYALEDREDTLTTLNLLTNGYGTIFIHNPGRETYLITSVFETGIKLLAQQYPEHVSLEMSEVDGKEN